MISTLSGARRLRHQRTFLAGIAGLLACSCAAMPAGAAALSGPSSGASSDTSTGVTAFPAVTEGPSGFAASSVSRAGTDARNRSASDWWTEDVWQDPDRPFLYYGNPEEEEKAARRRLGVADGKHEEEGRHVRREDDEHIERKGATVERLDRVEENAPRKEDGRKAASPTPSNASPLNDPELTSFTTVKGLRAEVERRLERALMDPTPEHVSAYLEANAFILGKAHRFQVAWERTRFAQPQYDWTASHPVANFATAEENERVMREKSVFLKSLADEAGILFVVRADDPLSELAARSLASFARTNGIEVLVASDRPVAYAGLPPSKPYNALIASLGLTRLPAAVLVPNPAMVEARTLSHPALRANPRPTLFATGVVSVEELGSRLMLLLAPPATEATDAVAATRNGRALTTGEAWRAETSEMSGAPASERLNTRETLDRNDFARSRTAHAEVVGEFAGEVSYPTERAR